MTEEMLKALVSQGGFAVLAAILIYLGWRDKREGREDMKEARQLFVRVLDMTGTMSSALTANTAAVDALKAEVAGVRAGIHDRVIPAISGLQLEALEKHHKEVEHGRPNRTR